MATAIQFLRSSVPSLRPTPQSLSEGMPMVNFNASDPGLYLRLNDQSLVKIGPTHVNTLPPNYNPTGFAGLCAGEMWLDMSSSATKPRPVLRLWDGTQWVDAGGTVNTNELPQARNTVYAGPESGQDALPTFRSLIVEDLPEDIPLNYLAGGTDNGKLIIGGINGWGENYLGLGDNSLSATLGNNELILEVTAGNIAGVGPNGQIETGDGHVQLNYDGKFTADNRFKFLRAGDGLVHSYTSSAFGQNAAVHTHTFIGATSFEGDVTLTNLYDLTVGGDLFVGHNVQIGSNPNELLEVFNKTEFNSDVFIKDFNNLDVGGNTVVHSNTTLGDADTNTLTVAATSTFNASMTVGRGCVTGDLFTANADAVFECDVLIKGELSTAPGGTVEFPGDVVLGTDCTDFIKIQGTQLNNCDIFVGTNVPDPNAQMLTIEAATGNLTTKGEVFITEKLTVSDPLSATPPKFVVDGSTGDVDSEGTVTAKFFSGDGSQLFNLAVPNSMLFHGDINATTGGDPVPTGAQPGDFYLNNTTGTVDASWPNIGGQPIQQDQFIYYSQDTPTTFKWNLGSVQNNQGFVTINTAQDINGSKTFKAPTFFDEYIEVRNQKTTLLTGTLTVKEHTQLDDTLTVADNKATLLGGTLTVKDDTEIRGDLTVQDGQDTVLGKDLTVKQNATIGSGCTNLLTVNAETKFNCGLEIGDPLNPCVGGAFNIYSLTNIFCNTKITKDLTVEGSTELGTGCTDLLTVFAQTLIKCATTITNTFEVSGNFATSLGGTLTVTGTSQLNNTLTVTGDTTLSSKLSVTGDTTLGATLTVSGATTLSSTLTVNGTSQFNAAVTVDSTLDVTGNTSIGGSFTVADNKASTLGGTLTVKGNSTLQGTLTVSDNQATTLGGTLLVKQATTLGNAKDCAQTFLTVNGKSVFECLATFNEGILIPGTHDLEVGGDITGHGDLAIDGDTSLGTSCSNTLTVNATTTINCATTIVNTLTVSGNFATTLGGSLTVADGKVTTLGGTLTVKGATTLQSTLTVTGATQLNSTLTVADNQATTLGGTLLVKLATTLQNTLTVSQATTLNGSLTVANNQTTTLGGTLTVKQAATLQSTLTVTGATQLNDTLTVADGKGSTLGGTLLVKQATTLGAAVNCGTTILTVNGKSTFNCEATFSGGISIPGAAGDLTVGGNLTVNGNTVLGDNCSDTLTITATTTINCATTIANTLTVSGAHATALGGTLTVTGATTLSSTLAVTGAATLSSTLTVTGATTLNNTLRVVGAATLNSTLSAAGLVTFTNNATNALTITGKARSASTVVGDVGTTLVTKDYVDANSGGLWEISGTNIQPIAAAASKHVVPRADGQANLGSTTLRWANLYTQDMHFSNEGTAGNDVDGTTGNWTLQEGHDHLYFINNKTGVKFRVVMEKV